MTTFGFMERLLSYFELRSMPGNWLEYFVDTGEALPKKERKDNRKIVVDTRRKRALYDRVLRYERAECE